MTLDLHQLCGGLGIPLPRIPSVNDRVHIRRLDTLARADAGTLCFAESASQREAVAASAAAAVLVPEDFPDAIGPLLLRVAEPRNAFFTIAEQFAEPPANSGIHTTAVVAGDAELGDDLSVGACAVIASGARIGTGCVIGAGCYIGPGVIVGDDSRIEPNATLLGRTRIGRRCIIHAGATIGGDGFGFRWDGQGHRKVPQIGEVVIEDDVEIGCNACVDRATLGVTRIGRGSKIDNLVQIAHNTDLGEHVIMAGQAGIAGSSRIGSGTVVGGQVAITDHVQVGAGARIGGQAGVTKDVDDGATVFGTPARPIRDSLRELAALAKLPGLFKRLQHQEQELEALKARLAAIEARALK
jgi:UDP-3-O-[3-hydroxymyristoyl] glucosamine N-acyltransferase